MRVIVQLTRYDDRFIRELEKYMDIEYVSQRSASVTGVAPDVNIPRIRNLPFVVGVYEDVRYKLQEEFFRAPETPVDFVGAAGKFFTNWQVAEFMGHEGFKAKPIKVAVLDTGINDRHPSLRGAVYKKIQIAPGDKYDPVGHGTWIAGTIAARPTDTDIGTVAGSAQGVRLIDIKVLDDNSTGFASYIIQGIDRAIDEGARVINMSLATPGQCIPPVAKAIQEAAKHAVVVCAAGNYFKTPGCPANMPETISVGSVYPITNGQLYIDRSPFSPQGVDLVAIGGSTSPPVYIVSTVHDTFKGMAGTSMSTPFVTSAAALALSYWEDLDPQGVKELILGSTTRWYAGYSPLFGYGLLNFKKVVNNARSHRVPSVEVQTRTEAVGLDAYFGILFLLFIYLLLK